ncbi:MAG: sensor histidine kinase [Cytophagales bacterium]|nr:MAG: sensor histidine kinase [Cytophagales bacterium]
MFCFSYQLLFAYQTIDLQLNTDIYLNSNCYKVVGKDTIKNNMIQQVDFGFDNPNGHTIFYLKNNFESADFYLTIQQSRVDWTKGSVSYPDGHQTTLLLINKSNNITTRPYFSVDFVYKIRVNKNEKVKIDLFSGRKFGNHACVLSMKSQTILQESDFKHHIYLSIIFGSCTIICLLGLFFYLFFKIKIYAVYALYCFFNILLCMADAGYFHSFYTDYFSTNVQNNLTTNFFYFTVACHILLTMVLLNISRKNTPILFLMGSVSVALFASAGLLLFFSFINFDFKDFLVQLSYYILFYMQFYIIITLIYSIKKRYILAYFYMAAFVFTLVASSILLLANLGIIDGVNQNYDFGYAIPLVEIFFIMIGIAIQFSMQNKELQNSRIALLGAQKRVISIQDTERERIARDLHDGIGQELILLKSELKDKTTIDAIIDDLRTISRDLHPVGLKKVGLRDTIENLCEQISMKGIFFISADINYTAKIQPDVELQLYRIIQEAVNNSIKHSNAKAIKIEINQTNDSTLEIIIKDNGIGFDSNASNLSSFGIDSMTERTKSLQGSITIISNNKGTIIEIKIPLQYD